jgi:hypothetical protein
MSASGNITRKPVSRFRTTTREVVVSSAFRLSIFSHVAAMAGGAVAAAAYLTDYSNSPQSLHDVINSDEVSAHTTVGWSVSDDLRVPIDPECCRKILSQNQDVNSYRGVGLDSGGWP